MSRRSVAILAAWITGGLAVVAATITGLFLLAASKDGSNITNQGSGHQIVGNNNQILDKNPAIKKHGFLSLLNDTDVHLGDNVYPGGYGTIVVCK